MTEQPEHKERCNYKDCEPFSCGASITEQPNYETCQYCGAGRVVRPTGEWQYACHCDEKITTEQPNPNAMIFEQVNGCCKIIVELLNQLIPKTTHVEDCIITHKAWQDNNFKHLKGAFE